MKVQCSFCHLLMQVDAAQIQCGQSGTRIEWSSAGKRREEIENKFERTSR